MLDGVMSGSRCRRLVALLALCLSGLAIVACGGTSPTKPDVIARGNAICVGTLRSVRAISPPSGVTTGAALSAYLQRVLPIVEREVSQLRKLPRPDTDKALLNRYIDAVTQAGATYRALAVTARRNETSGVARELAALRSSPAASLARRYGLTECATAAATSPG